MLLHFLRFHATVFLHEQRARKELKILVSYRSGMRISLAVHSNTNAWIAVINDGKLGNWDSCAQPYLFLFNNKMLQFSWS